MGSLISSLLAAAALVCALTLGAAAADQPPPAGPYCGGDGGLRCGTWPFVFPFL
jgi:hypothetical protein